MTRPRLRGAVVAMVLAICMGAILILWQDLLKQQTSLNETRSDNMQWTISQALVEYGDMMWALHAAQRHDPEGRDLLQEFLSRFDVFYSRMDILGSGPIYQPLFDDPGYAAAFLRIKECIREVLPLIDGDPEVLRAQLPWLEEELKGMERDVRSFGLQALISFSVRNDAMRDSLMQSMHRVALLTAGMIATLLVLSSILYRDGRAGERQLAIQRRTAARLDTILNTSLDAIIVTDPRGTIQEFNGAAQRLFRLDEDAARGQNLWSFLVPDTSPAARPRHPARLVGKGIVELRAKSADGVTFPAEVNVERVALDDSAFLVSFIRDITRRKNGEDELIAARDRALAGERAKAGFVAMISHELRTPMNGILGMLTLLKGTKLDAEQRDYAEKMEISGQSLLRQVNDVLDISRAEAGRLDLWPQPTALEPLLRSVTDSLSGAAAARGNTILFEKIGALPDHILVDEGRLRQVLVNLIGNAIKFTSDGQVVLEAEVVKTAAGADALELRVSDTGIGMAEDHLPRIFEDFEMLDRSFARRQTGAGLGLAIVRRIVDAMDGDVFVESEPGEGSLFTVVLPFQAVDAPRAAALQPTRVEHVGTAAGKHVLVVEDNDINRAVLSGILSRRGCLVVEAVDGEAGADRAACQAFDMILMDISMPGIDGLEAARRIRAGGASCMAPIVAVTAHAGERERAAILKAGFTDVITKPIDARVIDDLLAGNAPRAAAPSGPVIGSNRVLDTKLLAKLCDELGCERLLHLVGRFTSEAETEVRWMSSAEVRQAPPADLADRAHRLAGAATSFGAWRLGERLRRIEAAARVGHRSTLATHLPGLRSDWVETRAALDEWIGSVTDDRRQAS